MQACSDEDELPTNITVSDIYQVSLNEFAKPITISDTSVLLSIKKQTIGAANSIYPGGIGYHTSLELQNNNYLFVATGYSTFGDFEYSDLVTFKLDVESDQTSEIMLFEKNFSKIQIGGASLLRLTSDTLLCFFFAKDDANTINIYVKKSFDNGNIWSVPLKINTIDNAYQHAASDRAILLSNRRILLPMAIGGTGGNNYLFCYYSDDLGENWKATKLFYMKGNQLYEPCIAELTNGRLLMTIRNQSGKIIFAYSDNQGLSWDKFTKSDIDSPDAPSCIFRIPDQNILLLAWNNNGRINDYQNRTPLSLAMSFDDGQSWQKIADLENTTDISAFYPCIRLHNQQLVISYTTRAGGNLIGTITVLKIPLSEILNMRR